MQLGLNSPSSSIKQDSVATAAVGLGLLRHIQCRKHDLLGLSLSDDKVRMLDLQDAYCIDRTRFACPVDDPSLLIEQVAFTAFDCLLTPFSKASFHSRMLGAATCLLLVSTAYHLPYQGLTHSK